MIVSILVITLRSFLRLPHISLMCIELKTGVSLLVRAITELKPDVLVACSRGGQYAARLLSARHWSGPTLLISAMVRHIASSTSTHKLIMIMTTIVDR
jgi:hypoxanthine phosphoribosyltransferase